jgi:hypothetical protein
LNLDRWFLKQVESGIRKEPRGDKTADCIDETFLKSYAEDPTKFSLADERVAHVSSCSYCMGCLLELRAARRLRGFWGVRYVAIAWLALASVVIGGIVDFVLHHWHPAAAHIQLGEFRRTLDLSHQSATDTPLHLPAALITLEVVLPQMSRSGVYDITVARGGNGGNRVARTKGNSTGTDTGLAVTVSLDLRNLVPGMYELSTQFQGENTPHLYALEIDPL